MHRACAFLSFSLLDMRHVFESGIFHHNLSAPSIALAVGPLQDAPYFRDAKTNSQESSNTYITDGVDLLRR